MLMNARRGLWRAWIFVAILWVIGTSALTWLILPESIASRKYQYIFAMRGDVPDPNNVDWNKPLYEIMRSPSRDKLSVAFDFVPYQYISSRDEDVNKGTEIRVEFPDGSKLYLNVGLNGDDRTYLSAAFWDQRWVRWGKEGLPWLAGAIVPPIILLLLGSFLFWVVRGFAHD
jgi:hypothetical protein